MILRTQFSQLELQQPVRKWSTMYNVWHPIQIRLLMINLNQCHIKTNQHEGLLNNAMDKSTVGSMTYSTQYKRCWWQCYIDAKQKKLESSSATIKILRTNVYKTISKPNQTSTFHIGGNQNKCDYKNQTMKHTFSIIIIRLTRFLIQPFQHHNWCFQTGI